MRSRHLALGMATAMLIASGAAATTAVAAPGNPPALPALPQLPGQPPQGVPAAPAMPTAPVGAGSPAADAAAAASLPRVLTEHGRETAPVDVNALRDPAVRDRVDPAVKVEPGNLVAFGDSVFANPSPGDISNAAAVSAQAKKDPKAYAVAREAGVNVSLHGCAQGAHRLPLSVAERMGVPLNDYSCPGATVYSPSAKPPIGHQVDLAIQDGALNPATRYVILQGGFNDIYQNYHRPDGELAGSDRVAQAAGLETQKELYARNIDEMVGKIKAHAPNARISLVGYHTITECSKSGWQCLYHAGQGRGDENVWDVSAAFPVYPDTEGERNINKWLRAAAERNGVNFIDLRSKTTGHGECAAPEDRWVAGIFFDQTTAPYNLALHLTDEGIDNIAPMITAEL